MEKKTKNYVSKNVHPSQAPGPFWPNRDADRTLITTVGCVVRRGRKNGHGSPNGGALGPPRRGPERPTNPQGNAKHNDSVDFLKI